jgi:hypothetical protein
MNEILRAGLGVPDLTAGASMEAEALPGRDLFEVAKFLLPTDAHMVHGCLVASGVPAVVADLNQADLMFGPALGGVRILAPEAYLSQAREVLAAYERGDYALDDDADVGESS